MRFHSTQKDASIARILWCALTALVLVAIAPLAFAQQVIAPATISFGNVPLTVPVTQTGTFSNNSTFQSVTITALSTSDARFVAVGSGGTPCNVGAVLNSGVSCTYALTFTPTGTGAYNNTTTVAYDLVGVPQTPLTQASNGTGFLLPSSYSPPSLSFGNVPLTLATSQNFTFTNDSNTTPPYSTPYTITSFTTTGLGFTAAGSGGNPCAVGLVLAPGASCGGTVTFQIGGAGASNGTTTIGFLTGLGANPPYTQSIASSGLGFVPPSTLTPPSISFGNVPVGPVTQSFSFTNTSNGTAFPSTYLRLGGGGPWNRSHACRRGQLWRHGYVHSRRSGSIRWINHDRIPGRAGHRSTLFAISFIVRHRRCDPGGYHLRCDHLPEYKPGVIERITNHHDHQ
ncbi:MAG: choice-of-anchor D domain-containing protein [Betaproteobacteria bacterium]|nr:choice-of-anchor D domain-containing protein [Betaproteobacteria bacterium]